MSEVTNINVLNSEAINVIINTLLKKLDMSKLIALSLDEYNKLYEDDNVDDDAYYFIIDKEDELFEKIKEISDNIEELESNLKVVQDFKNSFPVDNRTYGIINQQPKNLSEVFPDQLGIPSDKNSAENTESI